MPTFDVVSEIDSQEVHNAVENAQRELSTRFDFRGVEASFQLTSGEVRVAAEAELQLQQMVDILRNKLVKRGIDPETMSMGKTVFSGKTCSQTVVFKEGIDAPTAKKIVRLCKDKKLKVQASIQGEQVRVSGKKRDELQTAISTIKEAQFDQPFQFTNFRD